MANEIVREREYTPGDTERTVVRRDESQPAASVMSKVVYAIFSILITLLLLRFLLALLGANRSNDVVHALYNITNPFISPFANFFTGANNVTVVSGSRFETETLIAIVFYVLLGWIIARLVAIFDARATV